MGNKSEFYEDIEDSLFQSNWFEAVGTFEQMHLDKDLLASVVYDFKKPTLVQQRAIKPCINDNEHDVIIEAPSGSGKTTAVAISLLQLIDIQTEECQALVLVPDSKNAQRVQETLSVLGDFAPNFKCHVCDKERRLVEERRCYDMGVNVLVGTPADVLRLFAHDSHEQKNKIRVAVLDGVDKLLVGSCKSQVYELFGSHLCSCSRIIALSTTLPKELNEFKEDFMNETVQIVVKKDDFFSFQGVQQYYITVDNDKQKLNHLNSVCSTLSSMQVIIFCSNRRKVDELVEQMEHLGHSVLSMHVEPAVAREQVIKHFLARSCSILITSDYLRCEFRLPKSVVINYDLPQNPTIYSSRLGHDFGCARILVVLSFVSDRTRSYLTNIEKFYKTSITEIPTDNGMSLKDIPIINQISVLQSDSLSTFHTHPSVEIATRKNMNGIEESEPFLSKKRRKVTNDQVTPEKKLSPNSNSSNKPESNK